MESRTSHNTTPNGDISDTVNETLVPAVKDCAIVVTEKEEVTNGGWKKQSQGSNIGWGRGSGKGGWATTWESRKDVPRGRTWAERFEEQRIYFRKGSTAENEQTAAKE